MAIGISTLSISATSGSVASISLRPGIHRVRCSSVVVSHWE
ncbi:hypothetical protein [Acidipropionibacterium jensenii]|nr:hypothetical protein [Acidipropionibacterium jensenii]